MIPTFENVDTNVVSKVFVLYTGGTIGMTRNTRQDRNIYLKCNFYDKDKKLNFSVSKTYF